MNEAYFSKLWYIHTKYLGIFLDFGYNVLISMRTKRLSRHLDDENNKLNFLAK